MPEPGEWEFAGQLPRPEFRLHAPDPEDPETVNLETRYTLPPDQEWQNLGNLKGPRGWVQVGFYLVWLTDNGDGTATFWRQWYCRRADDSNIFDPQGEPEEANILALPPGPQGEQGVAGDYFNITSANPPGQPHVAFFYKQRLRWDGTPATDPPDPQEFGGVIAPEGPIGNYYRITADNPDGEPDTVAFYRRLYDGETDQPAGELEQIGQAVAAQGPVGPQGPPGPTGGFGSGVIPTEDWWQWSVVCRYMVDVEAERVARFYALAAITIDALAEIASALVAARRASPTQPPGKRSLPGTRYSDPADEVNQISEYGPDMVAPSQIFFEGLLQAMDNPAVRDNAARELYCMLMPYRDLSDASINGLASQLNIGDYFVWQAHAVAGRWTDLLICRIVAGMYHDKEGARVGISIYRDCAAYDPLVDYSSLPCTPELGDWQRVYDFEVDDYGWLPTQGLGGVFYGEWEEGEGWSGTEFPGSGAGGHAAWINFTLPSGAQLTHIEVLFTSVAYTEYQYRGLYIYGSHDQSVEIAQTQNTGSLINLPGTNIPANTTLISVLANGILAGTRIKRVSITGTGTPPPPV